MKVEITYKRIVEVPDDWEVIDEKEESPAVLKTSKGKCIGFDLETVEWERDDETSHSGNHADDDLQFDGLFNEELVTISLDEKVTIDDNLIYHVTSD